MIAVLVLLTVACHHSMDSWPSDTDRQDVAMYFRTRSLLGISSLPPSYQFFIYDKSTNKLSSYPVNSVDSDGQLKLKLFPGTYTGYCITNADDQDNWEYSDNSNPEQVLLNINGEARDYCLGTTDFEVRESGGNAVFDLQRKVAMLKVIVENMPDWLTDLQINLPNLHNKMSLLGTYSGQVSLTKDLSPAKGGTSETSILLFPPEEQVSLTLSSNSLVFVTPVYTIQNLQANHVTELKAVFNNDLNKPSIDITAENIDWDQQVFHESDWNIDPPQGPCKGQGNGINLVNNGGFENGFTENIPTGWKLEAGGASKKVVQVNSPVHEGSYAVSLKGKTYLYQDVPVTSGTCYQLKLFVNAPNANVKWRYWYTWMQGSKNLDSDAIRSSAYQYQTEGYLDVFNGQVFRAPANANKLRVEIRSYMDNTESEGLYVDCVSVEAVN